MKATKEYFSVGRRLYKDGKRIDYTKEFRDKIREALRGKQLDYPTEEKAKAFQATLPQDIIDFTEVCRTVGLYL